MLQPRVVGQFVKSAGLDPGHARYPSPAVPSDKHEDIPVKAIHLLCHQEGLRPRNSEELPPKGQGRYRLGWWALTSEEADSLLGGFAYLHEKSSAASYSENRVEGHMLGEGEWSGLVGLILIRQPQLI